MQTKDKVILGTGAAGSAATAGTCIAVTTSLTGPIAHLGGYATAQIILGGGPALSTGIATIGGPIVAGAIASAGVGLAIIALGYGGYHLYKWVTHP
jgi:hypothetical protein